MVAAENRSVEYKASGWSLHPTKRRITITDKKGIGELKLLGKWDIHTYPVKSIKRVRLVRRAASITYSADRIQGRNL